MSEQITSYIAELDEKLIGFEDAWESQRQSEQDKLNSFRFAMSRMRRYLSPQLETFEKIAALADIGLVHKKEQRSYQARWRDCANSVKRDIEALAEMRERVVILRDAWQQHTNEKSNQVMYLLSVVATFFLPMTFIASLLGMNVDGIPGANHPWAFMVVSSSMIALGILQWVLFRRWQWLK
jgi:zinc transporter